MRREPKFFKLHCAGITVRFSRSVLKVGFLISLLSGVIALFVAFGPRCLR